MKTNCLPDTRRLARKLACLALAITTLAAWTVSAATLHVWLDSPNPMPPYDSWGNAASNIQDAVDAAADGDTVLVAGGVYSTGGRAVVGTMTNRVAIDKAITVESLMGPEVTVIEGAPAPGGGNGDGAVRGVYLGTNAALNGFTLTNGHTRKNGDYVAEQGGGGAWCENSAIMTNCIIAGNSAGQGGGCFRGTLNRCTFSGNSATNGGGSYWGTLDNCILSGNSAAGNGGGSVYGTFYTCTLTGNSASFGGGAAGGRFYNCIVYFNSAPTNSNYAVGSTFNYSCTTPLPTNGIGNIDLDPHFIDTNGWNNLRLQSNSPCINAGNNDHVTWSTDLDGNPRIVSGTVDIGPYEFQGPGSIISYAWLQQFELPTDGSADTADLDGDLMNSWQEWLADTDPTNALSFFHIETISKNSPAMILFPSSSSRIYTLWRTPQLTPPDWTPVPGEQAVPGNGGTLTLSDPTNAPQQFYRVQVNLP